MRIPCSGALPLGRRGSVMGGAHYEVHIWHASSILVGSAMSKASCFELHNGLASHGVAVAQWRSVGAWNSKVWGAIPHWDSDFFLCSTLVAGTEGHLSTFLHQAQNFPPFLLSNRPAFSDLWKTSHRNEQVSRVQSLHKRSFWVHYTRAIPAYKLASNHAIVEIPLLGYSAF